MVVLLLLCNMFNDQWYGLEDATQAPSPHEQRSQLRSIK